MLYIFIVIYEVIRKMKKGNLLFSKEEKKPLFNLSKLSVGLQINIQDV